MTKVNRSTYQKVVEENKRLIADIRVLSSSEVLAPEKTLCAAKWQKVFEKEKEFNGLMKAAATRYILDHADELPDFLTAAAKREQELPAPNTVMWWLCRIADPEIRRKAVVGYLEHGTKMDLPFYNRVGSAIDHIDWIDTDEGVVYWMSLYETADEIPLLSEPDFTEYNELRK